MTDLKTNQELLQKLHGAATRTPSAEQIKEQRVSFVMGSLSDKNTLSREQVEEILRKQGGI